MELPILACLACAVFPEAAILGLHSRVCQAAHEVAKTAYLWRRHRLRYYFLEDVQKAAAQPSHQAVGRIHLAEVCFPVLSDPPQGWPSFSN